MQRQRRFLLFSLILLLLGLSACATDTPVARQTLTATPEVFPSDTPTESPLPTETETATPSPTITPTATPVYYEVQLNDDMYGIAFRYGLEPQALMTANPDVNPNAMVVGMQLLIPITPSPEPTATPTLDAPTATPTSDAPTATMTEAATSTPQAVILQEPDCYPDAAGGLWCFVLATNGQDTDRENVSAQVTLSDGEAERDENAIMPLNLLPAGAMLPLTAYFEGPLPGEYTVTAELGFFLPVMPDDVRYLPVEIIDATTAFNEDGDVATVTGTLVIPDDQREVQYAWVSATAFDAEGHILAVRRWEADAPVTTGSNLPFEISLYSFAGEIDRVSLLAEAQPKPETGE